MRSSFAALIILFTTTSSLILISYTYIHVEVIEPLTHNVFSQVAATM